MAEANRSVPGDSTDPSTAPELDGAAAAKAAREAAKAEKKAARAVAKATKKATREAMGGNRPWFVPTMLGLMIFGLVWTVVYYLSAAAYPIAALGNWNLGVGFGFILAGFFMTTQWK